jgi:predicted nucleic acid-binding protein
MGCGTPGRHTHLLTEDLQEGFELAGVRFVNPFDRRTVDWSILPPE